MDDQFSRDKLFGVFGSRRTAVCTARSDYQEARVRGGESDLDYAGRGAGYPREPWRDRSVGILAWRCDGHQYSRDCVPLSADSPMKVIKIIAQILWTLFWIGAGTLLGVSAGWAHHGWPGAIVSGIIGFGVGAALAASPQMSLWLLS